MRLFSSKRISIVADIITVVNFVFSLIPVATTNPKWFIYLTNSVSNEFRFIVFTVITLVSSLGISKIVVRGDNHLDDISLKMTSVAIFSVIFAWIVVFNMRVIALNDNLEGSNKIIFLLASWLFLFFSSIKIHYQFKALDYEFYKGGSIITEFIDEDKGNYTPKYIRTIKLIAFWFIIIIGGFYYNF